MHKGNLFPIEPRLRVLNAFRNTRPWNYPKAWSVTAIAYGGTHAAAGPAAPFDLPFQGMINPGLGIYYRFFPDGLGGDIIIEIQIQQESPTVVRRFTAWNTTSWGATPNVVNYWDYFPTEVLAKAFGSTGSANEALFRITSITAPQKGW